MEKKAIYYKNSRGTEHVKDFIDSLDNKTKAKVLARIQHLEKYWHELKRPFIDNIEKDLYELRVQFARNKVRIIYAYMFKDYIVLLHGIMKKTSKISENDKLKAKKRMYDFQIKYNEGRIKLK